MAHHREHIVLFPFMARGHIIPFMALARLLEQKTSYTITFFNTPRYIQTLQSTLPSTSTIRLASLPFKGSDHGLPPNVESTEALPFIRVVDLFKASETLQASFDHLISTICEEDGGPPLCIISDMFLGWTVEVANKLGVFHSVFIASGAYGTAIFFSLWLHVPLSQTSEMERGKFLLPDFPESNLIEESQIPEKLRTADGKDPLSCFIQRQLSFCLRSDGFLLNTVEELEKTGLWYFSRITNWPVWAIGPLTDQGRGRSTKEHGISVDRIVEWLNLHRPFFVLFLSVGSQNTISASMMMKLAMGLEESGKAFIWVVRPPLGNDIYGEFRAEWLPEGFEERITERKQGLLVRKWAPQKEILSHESTGAFLSHCGWNLVVESLSSGVPLIGWPISAEQFYNSKMLVEEVGVCLEIARGDCSEIEKGRVSRAIEIVMGETEEGEKMRKKALEIKKMMEKARLEGEGSSAKAMDEYILCRRRGARRTCTCNQNPLRLCPTSTVDFSLVS